MSEKTGLREWGSRFRRSAERYKYVLLILLAGVVLLLLPDGGGKEASETAAAAVVEEDFSVEALEQKLEQTLSEIDGAGEVRVMLTVQSGMKRVLAQNKSAQQDGERLQQEAETVVVSSGSGTQETVLVQQVYPKFQGALVVAEGGGDPAVKLKLTEAVSAVTGIGADKISICKGK